MQKNCADMRNKLADVGSMQEQLQLDNVNLDIAIGSASESQDALRIFNEEMDGDFELMKHKPQWNKAIDAFQAAASGENKDIPMTTEALAEFLCETLAVAEPQVTPNAAAFVAKHPLDENTLKVFCATEASELKDGSTLRVKEGAQVPPAVAAAYVCMKTGEAELNNPHGLERISKVAMSAAPLKSMNGTTYAVIVSGPPAMPDELLETLARHAGPLMERVWKKEMAFRAIMNAVEFIKSFAISAHELVYVNYQDGATMDLTPVVGDDAFVWKWQALGYTDPNDAKKFVLPLFWRLGEPIGLLRIDCGTFTEMSEALLMLCHTMAIVIKEAIEELENLSPGETPPLFSIQKVMHAFEAKRPECSELLNKEIHAQLEYFDQQKVFAELRHLEGKHVDDKMLLLVQGCFVLMGYKESDVKSWSKIQHYLKNPRKLKDQMSALDLGAGDGEEDKKYAELGKRWNTSHKLTDKVDLADLDKRSSAPVKLLIRWLTAVELAHNIAESHFKETRENEIDPLATKIFNDIDADGDGWVVPKELVSYMVKEYGSKSAHQLLHVLDSDHDHKISIDEWHKGWNSGMMMEVILKAKEEKEEGGKERLTQKRRGQAVDHALAMAAAAQQHNRKSSVKSMSGTGGSSKATVSSSSKSDMGGSNKSNKAPAKLKPIKSKSKSD